jgi:hypothetical protein
MRKQIVYLMIAALVVSVTASATLVASITLITQFDPPGSTMREWSTATTKTQSPPP